MTIPQDEKGFLSNVGGFTPVIEALVNEFNFKTAYIWGIVWRYCQMEHGICNAKHETIAERAGMSHRSAVDHIHRLIEAGYIEDLTPDVKHAPHVYCTKKGREKILGMQNLHTSDEDKYAKSAYQKPEGMQNLHSRYAKSAHRGMQNLHSKIVVKESHEDSLKEKREKTPAPDYLTDVVTHQGKTSEATGPNPDDQWLGLRDKALAAFPGSWGRTPKEREIKRGKIAVFVAETPDFDIEHWIFITSDCIAHGVGANNIARMIEVYPYPDYNAFLDVRYPKNGASNGSSHGKPRRTQENNLAIGLGEYTEAEREELGLD